MGLFPRGVWWFCGLPHVASPLLPLLCCLRTRVDILCNAAASWATFSGPAPAMRASAALAALLCCAALRAGEGEGDGLMVWKCCTDREYLQTSPKLRCLRKPAAQASAPGNPRTLRWLPEWLRAEPDLVVGFGHLSTLSQAERLLRAPVVVEAEEQLGRRLLAVDADARRFVLEPFDDGVDLRAVADQNVCFDVTHDPHRPFVAATSLDTVKLNKCCAKGASLDARLQCRPPTPSPSFKFHGSLAAVPWLPAHLGDAVPAARVYYDVQGKMAGAEGAVVDADDPSAWRLLFPRPREFWLQAVWVRAEGGTVGASTDFCFDTTEAGSGLPARVLLAPVARLNKCCRRGQQLNHREMQCEVRTSAQVDARPTELLAPGDPSAYWLPRALATEGLALRVRYLPDWDIEPLRQLLPAERAQVVGFPDRPAAACVRLRTPSGLERAVCASDFCFEALADGFAPQVVAFHNFDRTPLLTLLKCCQQGHMLYEEPSGWGLFGASSSTSRCQQDTSEYWTPENSSLADELVAEGLYMGVPLNPCLGHKFTLVEEEPESELAVLGNVRVVNTVSIRVYCKDFLRARDGGPARDALAFCEVPDSQLYFQVRPVQVLAAALLAVAVGAVLAQPALRRTTHGCALACHAACLMAANALQAAWFFTHDRYDKPCLTFASVIYFFLMASAFWLNVISVNMAQGFRRPDGARSLEGDGGARRRWRLMALYAWGLPSLLTAVSVAALYLVAPHRRGHDSPTFFETRTCFTENIYLRKDLNGKSVTVNRKLGAVYYYYLPCGALVAANTVCLVMTLCRIRSLRSDAQFLQRKSSLLQSALLYVKLLLTAGVMEMVLETVVWAIHRRPPLSNWYAIHSLNVYLDFAVLGTFLDVARAVAVLWLSVGRWSRVRAAGRWLRARLRPATPPIAPAPPPPPAAPSPTKESASCSVPSRNHVTRL